MIIDAIGNTSMVKLRRVVPSRCADVFVKLEWENPTGSMKDRMAQAVIERAEADGRLKLVDTESNSPIKTRTCISLLNIYLLCATASPTDLICLCINLC